MSETGRTGQAPRRGNWTMQEGGEPAGRRVRLPRGARRPIRVHVNGIEQIEGVDYKIADGMVIFDEPIMKEGKLSGWRWAAMATGLFGTYRKHETVDIEYHADGRGHLLPDAEVLPD